MSGTDFFSGNSPPRVAGVILTYRPDSATLLELVRAVCPQLHALVIVDNGTPWDPAPLQAALDIRLRERVHFIWLPENLGVGTGHNRGIAWAREQGFDRVLILDQDSIPAPGMVSALTRAEQEMESRGNRVGAVGPQYRDRYTGTRSGFVRLGALWMKRVPCGGSESILETDFVISSGALIPMRVLDDVGTMDESLFIDHVDTEWVFRARSRGYRTFGACGAVMEHTLGTATFRVWLGRWRNVALHSPERNYYLFRNTVVLARRPYAPRAWVVAALVRLVGLLVLHLGVAPERGRRLRLMARGVRDGIRGRTGPLQQ